MHGNEDGYDVLDPDGNITIKWDEMVDNGDTQNVSFLQLFTCYIHILIYILYIYIYSQICIHINICASFIGNKAITSLHRKIQKLK